MLLDADHVFTNLVDNGDGTTSLVDGAYEAIGGDININGLNGATMPEARSARFRSRRRSSTSAARTIRTPAYPITAISLSTASTSSSR